MPQNYPRDGSGKGFEVFARHSADLGALVPLRLGAGDNVNCFNLNTTLQPRFKNSRARPRPMPRVLPVTMTVFMSGPPKKA